MANLPLELFYQIALHLPSTSDVLTFSLTSSRVREALSTPALFKERLAMQDWDVSAWLEEDRNLAIPRSPQEDLERWTHIDYIYFRTVQLFDEAAADDYFLESPPDVDVNSDTREPEPELASDVVTPQSSDQSSVSRSPSFDKQKTILWLQKLNEVLPAFLTHHRAFPGALLCQVLLFKNLVFLLFRRRKHLANHRSKTSRRSLDSCEGFNFDLLIYHPKSKHYPTPPTQDIEIRICLARALLLLFSSTPHTM